MVRPSWAEVDLGAIADNARELRELVAPARLCAVVKADGYGHGDVPVAEAALEAGADVLAVALVEEGIRLREAGIDAPVLLLSEPPLHGAAEAIRWGLTPTVYREEFAAALSDIAPRTIPVHIKVDTGMHRVGVGLDRAVDLIKRVDADPHLQLEGAWTHFAVADENDPFTETQIDRFMRVLADLETLGIQVPVRHAANTAGAMRFPQARFDMVRIGIGLYGINPAPDLIDVPLRPAMRIVSQVAMVRRHPGGTRLSYGRTRALEEASTVATVPVGYADGLPRALARDGEVLIGGLRHPFAGNVTMDQVLIDVGDLQIEVGDEVVLIGRQGDQEVSASEWATRLGTIAYEVVCQIGPRLPRTYV